MQPSVIIRARNRREKGVNEGEKRKGRGERRKRNEEREGGRMEEGEEVRKTCISGFSLLPVQ